MLIQGRLTEAKEICQSSIDRAIREGHGDFPATGWLHIAMARVELERGHLDEAEGFLRDGLRIARPGGFSEAVRSGRYLRARLADSRGDLEAGEKILHDTARIVNAMDEPYLIGELNWQWAMHYLKAGDLETAGEKLQIMAEKAEATQHANLLLWQGWLVPRLMCAEGRCKEALTFLEEYINRARAGNNNGELIHLLALQAIALDVSGDRIQARSSIREALALGEPESYIWTWLNIGPEIAPLLRDAKADSDTPQKLLPYLDTLLETCQTEFGESTQSQPSELVDPLTPRELEIMRLISKGHSNPEIASVLVVTINTIKKHTSNIYGKLGVRSRTQAIARARKLNLL
jgi:LuxR family maltose regulon positive regulatory protein